MRKVRYIYESIIFLVLSLQHRTKHIQAYLIKDPECLSDLLLTVSVLHLPCHHCQELREVNGTIAWGGGKLLIQTVNVVKHNKRFNKILPPVETESAYHLRPPH